MNKRRAYILAASAIVIAGFSLVVSFALEDSSPTKLRFDRIQNEMTIEDTVLVFQREPTRIQIRRGWGGWAGWESENGSEAIVYFRDNRVCEKEWIKRNVFESTRRRLGWQ